MVSVSNVSTNVEGLAHVRGEDHAQDITINLIPKALVLTLHCWGKLVMHAKCGVCGKSQT